MENLINSNSPAEQVVALNSLVNKANAAIDAVIGSNEVLNQKALQLRNHEMATATDATLGHVKASDDLVVEEDTKQLKVNPVVVDSKIEQHEADNTAHGDIRETLEIIPRVITGVSVAGPGTVKTGVPATFTVQAIPLLTNSIISRIEVILPSGEVLAKSGVNVVDNATTFEFALVGDDLSVQTIKVRAIDSFGSKSELYEHAIVISTNNPPVLDSAVVNNLPAIVKPSGSYVTNITGGVDSDGDAITYSITNVSDPTNITFSKTSGIGEGESLQINVSSGITRNQTFNFTIVGTDGRFGGTSSKVVTFKTNSIPVSTGVTLSGVPAFIKPNTTYSISVTGGTDIDGQDLTYAVAANIAGITFSKSTGILAGESVDMIVGSGVTRGADLEVSVSVSDGVETSVAKVFTGSKVNNLPDASSIQATNLPANVFGGAATTFTLSGGSDVDGHDITYKIVGGAGLNISPTLGIVAGSNISINATKVAAVTPIEFTVFAIDSLGEESATGKTFSVTVDPIVKTSTPSIISPTAGQAINLPFTFQASAFSTYIEL